MQTVDRSGVQFDMCPSCRGVWLDRGELEKLMAAGREDRGQEGAPQSAPSYAPPPRPAYPPRDEPRRDDYRRDDYRSHDARYHQKKKRGFDLFDIFD